jgi:hypothetical protein
MASVLNVDQIGHSTSGTTALTIDSSGRVLMPNKPFVSAAWNGSGTTAYSTPLSRFTTYNTTDTNIGSGNTRIIYKNDYNMLDTTNGLVTIPVTGIYLIVGHYAAALSGTLGRRIGHLFVTPSGGSITDYGEWVESYGTYDDSTGTKLLSLNANDQVAFGHNVSVINWDAFGFEMILLG